MWWICALSLCGGVGCAARALARDALIRARLESWVAIMAINLVGAAAIGAVAGASNAHLLLAAMLAGWTTSSAFSVDAVLLCMRGRLAAAAICWAATIVACPLAAYVTLRLLQEWRA